MIYVCLCSYLTDKCWKILQERWTSRIYVYLYRRFDSICMKGGSEIYSFNQLFTDYKGRFVHFANTYVGDSMVAEDIAIESLMYYWENKDRLPADTNIPAYVLTTIKHKCIDHLRRQQIRQDVSDEISQIYAWELSGRIVTLEDFEPYEVFTAEIQEIVDKTLDSLPEQTRRIFRMSRYENKSHKEIAALLEMTTKGVEFHISKSTRALRLALKDYLPVSLLFFYLN